MFDFFVEETTYGSQKQGTEQATQKKKERLKRLYFRAKGTKKYKFTLIGEMGLNAMYSRTKTETSWILQILDISEQGYTLDLVSYDVNLIECNSDAFRELFYITRQFQKLYDEIKVQTDIEGNLVRVLNSDRLFERWKQIKNETIQYFNENTDLNQFFAIKDDEFTKPDILYKIVREVEFFFIYLQSGGYGQKFSSIGMRELKRDNAFRTEQITWNLDFSGNYEIIPDSPLGKMNVKSKFEPSKKWLEKAYGEMPFVKVENLKPDFNLEGNYVFYNESGWLKEAKLEVNEIVHPNQLYHKMKYLIQEI